MNPRGRGAFQKAGERAIRASPHLDAGTARRGPAAPLHEISRIDTFGERATDDLISVVDQARAVSQIDENCWPRPIAMGYPR
jgi:hypothetical protein